MSEIAPIYNELAAKLGFENSRYIPQILARLANLEQAKILRELPASSAEEIAERLNMDNRTVNNLMQDLYEKGLLYYRRKKRVIDFCQDVLELHDATASNPKFDEYLGDQFFDLWDAWTDNEAPQWLAERLRLSEDRRPRTRIMPHWKSIKDTPGVLPCDDVREVLKENKDTLAINPCCCLRITKKPERGIPKDICIVVRKTGEYSVDRGSGRKITVKEALDILKGLERYALVHTTWNQKKVRRLISNSDKRCLIFRFGVANIQELLAPSRFQPTVDTERCMGCRICADNICLFGAAQMKYYPEFGEERAYTDAEKCMGCGNCVLHCPIGARTMKLVRPPEFIPDRID